MASKKPNPKLAFIQSIAQQSRRHEHEISSEMKSAVQSLQAKPKSYYSIQDVEEFVETLRNKMISLNKEAHTEFSKRGIRDLDNIDLVQPESESMLIGKEEFQKLKEEIDSLRSKSSDLTPLEMKIDDLQILLEEKEAEIAQLQNQTGSTSEKYQEQIEEINRLQEEK
ncbi:MAG: hypothetical protein ACXACP_06020 [Candidatus Hodarchaeales archaeon]